MPSECRHTDRCPSWPVLCSLLHLPNQILHCVIPLPVDSSGRSKYDLLYLSRGQMYRPYLLSYVGQLRRFFFTLHHVILIWIRLVKLRPKHLSDVKNRKENLQTLGVCVCVCVVVFSFLCWQLSSSSSSTPSCRSRRGGPTRPRRNLPLRIQQQPQQAKPLWSSPDSLSP